MQIDYVGQAKMELILRNYSPKTVISYCRCIRDFILFLNGAEPDDGHLVRQFLIIQKSRKIAAQTFNLYVHAIHYLYRNILKKPLLVDVKSARRSKRLPVVLSKIEIESVINSIKNRKHKLIIALSYGAGLRVSEVVKLRVRDIDITQSTLFIYEGKGRKDRITVIPQKLSSEITQYMAGKEPAEYLFVSERGGRLTERTAQKVFEQGRKRAGITKPATFHSLRHSFATHLIENGVDIRYVQELLGHASILTTQRYTHVAQTMLQRIASPLD